jgi:hypothetical protein
LLKSEELGELGRQSEGGAEAFEQRLKASIAALRQC